MQRVVRLLVAVLMLCLWLSGGPLAEGPRDNVGPFVLRNGLLIDGTGAEPVANATLVIERNRMVAIGAAGTVALPAQARQIDLHGATMVPGFINTHIHQGYDAQKLQAWARGGVTTVCDLGASLARPWFTQRKTLHQNPAHARLVAAGPMVTVPGGYPMVPWGGDGLTVTSPADATRKIRQLLQEGADLIKIALESGALFGQTIPVLSLEETTAIVEVAHAHGTVVTAHVTATEDLDRAIQAGVDALAHMVVDRPLPDAVIHRLIAADIYWVPTLELWYGAQQQHPQSMVYQTAVANLRRFAQAGGKVALGTDYAGYHSSFDLGMPMREIVSMQEAGMTPKQIIVAATKHAAHVCNLAQELGTLEPGKIADVLVVQGNPLEEIRALVETVLVIHEEEIIYRGK